VSSKWHLAQYNVAKLVAPLDDPRVAAFVASLQRVNTLGDRAPGFVWRLHSASGDSTDVRVDDDPLVVVNFTVWESIEALFEYTYHSEHVEVFRRRREWFEHDGRPYLAMWWVPAGHVPAVAEAEERLAHLRAHGPTPCAFNFKQRFSPGEAAAAPGGASG
jgi:heme-degrading monooxygenase HmoA